LGKKIEKRNEKEEKKEKLISRKKEIKQRNCI
jgi:hypothetical protein